MSILSLDTVSARMGVGHLLLPAQRVLSFTQYWNVVGTHCDDLSDPTLTVHYASWPETCSQTQVRGQVSDRFVYGSKMDGQTNGRGLTLNAAPREGRTFYHVHGVKKKVTYVRCACDRQA